MNTVTVSGRVQADPAIDHYGDAAVCELRLAIEPPEPDGHTSAIVVICFGELAQLAVEQSAAGDRVFVIGWLRSQAVNAEDGRTRQRIDVVAERVDFLGRPALPYVARDAHLEAAYEDRYELAEAW
jgi:single-stranded DNA-binding protein